MEIFKDKSMCCGCTACYNSCPKHAVKMIEDEKGFLYPLVNSELCVNCGICTTNCDFQKKERENFVELEDNIVFAVKHKDINERLSSRSGAAFMALCDYIIERGGSVYGAAFDNNLNIKHIRASDKEQVNKLKGSKYVQSELGDCFSQVKNDLLNGNYVLFSGTACQTSGLKSYLKNIDTSNLILCDIVCHGVPSPKFYRDYIKYIEKKTGKTIVEFNFRDKFFGWSSHIESYKTDKKYYSTVYSNLFIKSIMFRPSCGKCRYTNFNRPSDITLADFWGIDKAVSGFNDNRGVSLVIINTEKGLNLFNNVKNQLNVEVSNKKDCLQPNLQNPTVFSELTDEFWNDYKLKGIEYVIKKYNKISFKKMLKSKIKIFLFKYKFKKI